MIENRYVISQETAKQIWQTEKVFAYEPFGHEFLIETETDLMHAIDNGYALAVEPRK